MVRDVQSSIVEKSVRVVDLLAQAPNKMNQLEIMKASGLSKSSVYRILSILVGQGLVQFDEREKLYSVGPKLISWARAAWQKTDLNLIEDQDLASLSGATGFNVAVSVLSDANITFIRTHIPKPYKFAIKVGGQSELHCTAAGKVFLAYMTDTEQAAYYEAAKLEKFTESTITDEDALRDEVGVVRKQGYAFSNREEFWQIRGIAAPILDYDDRILAAISLWSPTHYVSAEGLVALAPKLMDAAAEISARFGRLLS
ncbi:IclR family transcriptional regulator [Epibacterium ulvae]|uniref:Transcriptional regulator, IclR family n=1 Tax=Epibacterium ulvae TaxID=1156985 RepID=A0A1G5R071_9RHOB|nr:IclR family transcriptional regulator [Epibacterium ulvae]SCZ67463.1 transcriptional regulator, IclR family [Epibacterium ulvae]